MKTLLSPSQDNCPAAVSQRPGQGTASRLVWISVAVCLVVWDMFLLLVGWVLMPANDFGRMLHSARAFVRGQDMYALTAAIPHQVDESHWLNLWNMNPPHFHLFLLPLTPLSDDYASIVWYVLSGWCLYQSLCWILAELQIELTPQLRSRGILFLLATPAMGSMLYGAQVSFVLMLPLTAAWIAARRRSWIRSGVLLGLLISVKPFLGILLAYFGWRRRWRALSSALAAVVLCFVVGVLIFGWHNHLSWREKLSLTNDWAWLPANAGLMGALTRTFTESIWFTPLTILSSRTLWLVWMTIGGTMGLLTLAATGKDDEPRSLDRDFGLLLAAALLLSPLGWVYYLWLVLPPLIALFVQRRHPAVVCPSDSLARRRRSRRFLWIAVLASVWPIAGTFIPGPGLPGRLFFSNIYFWGLLCLWAYLVWDGFRQRKEERRAAAPFVAPLHPADYRVSVIMPVYSETDTVRQIAEWLLRELGPRLHEILLVQSPRSSEESRAVCRGLINAHPQIQLHVQRENPGLGRAVREGFALATGNLVLMIDSDGEMEIETVPRLLEKMARGGYALVAASRWLPDGGFSGYSRVKYYLNWCFQQLFRWLFWTPLHDLTYGFKLMRAELVRGLDWQGTLHEIACETTLKPIRLGVAVAEVPSKWTARTQGVSKNTFWRNFRYVRTAAAILFRGVRFTPSDLLLAKERPMVQQPADVLPIRELSC